MSARKDTLTRSHSFIMLACVYGVILLVVSGIASYFSYSQKKEEFMADVGIVMAQLDREGKDLLENFWQVYMPVFEERTNFDVFLNYFAREDASPLLPQERASLSATLSKLALRSNHIQWIAVISDARAENYIYYVDAGSLNTLPRDFPYAGKLMTKSKQMEVYEAETFMSPYNTWYHSFAICGGSPLDMGPGKLLVGYGLDSFDQICDAMPLSIEGSSFHVLYDGKPLYDSATGDTTPSVALSDMQDGGIVKSDTGEEFYALMRGDISHRVSIYALVPYRDAFLHFHAFTPYIFAVIVLFTIISILIYTLMLHMIQREVRTIQAGLAIIGENQLSHRIPTALKQSGLPQIAGSINQMTERLQENIDKAYLYQLKQREAELSELQAKFNPHFLYNTLNMLSTRCYQNNDAETAELIIQLATIFRGFLGSRTFVPISDELAFSKKYLALFCARYEDRVQVIFDIDTQILQYGIIRNIFQPLIENYFVHGYDDQAEENHLIIRGRLHDENNILITIIDDGIGMDAEQMEKLNAQLREFVAMPKGHAESYGLQNIHQRLHLFYGGDCGLSLSQNGDKGLCVNILMRKMTCDEYEQSKAHGALSRGSEA